RAVRAEEDMLPFRRDAGVFGQAIAEFADRLRERFDVLGVSRMAAKDERVPLLRSGIFFVCGDCLHCGFRRRGTLRWGSRGPDPRHEGQHGYTSSTRMNSPH